MMLMMAKVPMLTWAMLPSMTYTRTGHIPVYIPVTGSTPARIA